MEGIQTIQALKAVQSSLPAQTTIPSDELVMLYAADGTPIAKIARDDLVKAVASVMASNSQNTFSKLLGVQANGTPMGIGASDLASVLGAIPVNHGLTLISNGNKTGLELAKEYFWNNMTSQVAFLTITPSDSNVFATIYKRADGAGVGRIEFHELGSGVTTIYKKGYSDSDFVLVQ